MNSGWIKIYRELLDKPIWFESTPEQKVILITLLLMANNQTTEWEWHGESYTAEPGQFVTSIAGIIKKSGKGISMQNVRSALARFEKYKFLTSESTNKNRLITINNWGDYQAKPERPNNQTNEQITSNQQTANKQLTTNKNLRTKELEPMSSNNVQEEEPDKLKGQVQQVVAYLNQKTGKSFKDKSKDTQRLISGRIHDGYKFTDFKRVIDNKSSEWLNDPEMDKFLRPATLFAPSHFDNYLNERPVQTAEPEKTKDELGADAEKELARKMAMAAGMLGGSDE